MTARQDAAELGRLLLEAENSFSGFFLYREHFWTFAQSLFGKGAAFSAPNQEIYP